MNTDSSKEQVVLQENEKLSLLKSLAAEGFGQLDEGQGIVLEDADELATHIKELGCRAAKQC
ncbi:MAG: hypothetical protein SH868_20015 [Bythopirellula sp.]|nr:hypothetical protein [Bythopirellula sp.]